MTDDLLTHMIKTAAELKALPPPPREIRLHPDDVAELRRRCVDHQVIEWQAMSWEGLPVIEDPSAARLPRTA